MHRLNKSLTFHQGKKMNQALKVLSKFIGTDKFYDMIDRVSDKILENGSLSGKIGNETQFTISVEIEDENVIVNLDLQPEEKLSLSADDLDEIGDFVADQVNDRVLKQLVKMAGANPDEISTLSNVTINGERPIV